MNPPSPVTATTRRCGYKSFAAIAPGTAIPMAANPLETMQEFGVSQGNIRAIQSLWAPTSHTTTSSCLSSSAKLAHDVLRAHRPRRRTSELGLKPVGDRLPGLPGP